MRYPRSCILISLCFFLPALSQAAITFPSLSQNDFNNVVKELSSDMNYHVPVPASSLGSVWGFELGVVGGITNTPDIQTLVNNAGASTKVSVLPHASVVGRLGLPYGITGELAVLPTITASSVHLREVGGAVQWTLTDVVLTDLPVTLAVKGFYNSTHLDFSQTINNSTTSNIPVAATVNFDDKIMGGQLLISKKIEFFEPSVGIGVIKADGTLSVSSTSSTATILGFTIPGQSSAQSAGSKPSDTQLLAGFDLRFGFFCLGAELDRVFGRNSGTGRLSFRF